MNYKIKNIVNDKNNIKIIVNKKLATIINILEE